MVMAAQKVEKGQIVIGRQFGWNLLDKVLRNCWSGTIQLVGHLPIPILVTRFFVEDE